MTTALVPLQHAESEWSVERIIEQTLKIKQCMQAVMKPDEHYGVIPGTGSKPTLLKPGAEKLCLMFRLSPEYETELAVEEPGFILFRIKCTLRHITTGNVIATGLGSCSSREEKYGWRKAARKCPKCSKEAIIKGKEEYGGGWLCFKKKDGCGAKFADGDKSIEGQEAGKVPAENIWDQHNTLLKMACKRALIAAVLNGTAASDFFTQDLEDLQAKAVEYIPPEREEDATARGEYREAVRDEPSPKGQATVAASVGSQAATATTSTTGRTASAGPTTTKVTPPPVTGTPPVSGPPPSPGAGGGTLVQRGAVDASGSLGAGQPPLPPNGTGKSYVLAKDVPVFAKDPLANQAQLAQIHILRKEVNWPDGEVDESKPVKSWPLYRQALAAYKTHDGKRCLHSNQLTFDQAANLIRRMQASKGRKEDAHAAMEAATAENVAHLQRPDLGALMAEHYPDEEDRSAWLMGLFGKSLVSELDAAEAGAALALHLKFDDDLAYAEEKKKLTALGVVRG